MFVKSVVTILSEAFGVTEKFTDEQIREALQSATFEVSQPGNVKIKKSDDDEEEEGGDDDEKKIQELAQSLRQITPDPDFKVNPIEFEKDDDSNGHIAFMTAFSNLRARNYTIEEEPFYKVKLIAGKIIPAIATTTAMVVGAVGMELYKYVVGREHTSFRNSFCNLALPNWVFSETMDPIVHEDKEMDPILFMPVVAIPPKWTNWQTIDVQGPKTVGQLRDELKERYNLEISMIISGQKTLYNEMSDQTDRLAMDIEALYKQLHEVESFWVGKKYLIFVLGAELDGTDADCPSLRYILPQTE